MRKYLTRLPGRRMQRRRPHTAAKATAESAEEDGDWPQVDFEALRNINPDVIGWIYIEGTDINYPIVQGKENNDYLRRMFDGTPNHAGSIFLDSRCSAALTDAHSIIYGHHMKNTTMFSELEQYKQQAFYDTHTWGWLITPEAHYKLQFFAGYVAETDADAWDLDLAGEKRQTWIEHAIGPVLFSERRCTGMRPHGLLRCPPAAMIFRMHALCSMEYWWNKIFALSEEAQIRK